MLPGGRPFREIRFDVLDQDDSVAVAGGSGAISVGCGGSTLLNPVCLFDGSSFIGNAKTVSIMEYNDSQ